MLCYKDRTYCPFYVICKEGYICDRALTPKVAKSAKEANLPISQFYGKPDCFHAVWEEEESATNESRI